MSTQKRNKIDGNQQFFLISLSHDNLVNHYQTNFHMMQSHKYSLSDIENMIPWEREVYVAMLIDHVKKENEELMRRTQNV